VLRPNWQRQDFAKWKDAVSVYDRTPFEAADEIECLRAERDALQSKLDFHRDRTAEAVAENKDAKAQLAALRAERDALREQVAAELRNNAGLQTAFDEALEETHRFAAERDALRELLREAFEWTGREPVPFDVPRVLALRKRIDAALERT
jgi:regulator of replication initiation timing